MKSQLKSLALNVLCLSCILLLAMPLMMKAQTLNIFLKSNLTETYALSDIRRVTFSQNEMLVDRRNGITVSYPLVDIVRYTFSQTTGLSEAYKNAKMSLYPNPATDKTRLHIGSEVPQDIKIELFDVSGKLINNLYEGRHTGNTIYDLTISAAPGCYLCTVLLGQETIRLPLIIQQ